MDLKSTILTLLILTLATAGLWSLWTFFRLWRSGQKTKGAKDRLRFPNPEGVAPLCGFKPSEDLVNFYKTSEVIKLNEIQFIDTRPAKPKAWHISNFTPVTPIDTREEIKNTSINGLPIANSGDGGVYYVAPSGSVHLRDPSTPEEDLLVAESVTAFSKFSPLHEFDDEDQDSLAKYPVTTTLTRRPSSCTM